ncbi:hypothetical protein M9980_13180 [Sphingomonas donggukensis]|uniref:Uncharacterized protein n=1 Tax=Sphingomonas donggukensis TaxID=2949093 RepID=A0ABY4TST2_9SPHN|nr:hypothetical protein [Sphingomonas donggukensis]URW75467.1 hypothetical protein M9980_13180 [Sphingomonas donggukensis]
MSTLRLAVPALALLIAGCGRADDADPGGISASEAQELNDAAAMLDANAIEINAVTSEGNAS